MYIYILLYIYICIIFIHPGSISLYHVVSKVKSATQTPVCRTQTAANPQPTRHRNQDAATTVIHNDDHFEMIRNEAQMDLSVDHDQSCGSLKVSFFRYPMFDLCATSGRLKQRYCLGAELDQGPKVARVHFLGPSQW